VRAIPAETGEIEIVGQNGNSPRRVDERVSRYYHARDERALVVIHDWSEKDTESILARRKISGDADRHSSLSCSRTYARGFLSESDSRLSRNEHARSLRRLGQTPKSTPRRHSSSESPRSPMRASSGTRVVSHNHPSPSTIRGAHRSLLSRSPLTFPYRKRSCGENKKPSKEEEEGGGELPCFPPRRRG